MKTIITISSAQITVTIAGVAISINKEELFTSLKQVENFIWNVFPESHKEELKTSGFGRLCEQVHKYQPLVEKLLSCMKLENEATSIIAFNEDGTISMRSSEQSANFDMKKYLEVISEFSKLQQEEFAEKQAKREQEEKEAEEEYARSEREFEESMEASHRERQEAVNKLEKEINKAFDKHVEKDIPTYEFSSYVTVKEFCDTTGISIDTVSSVLKDTDTAFKYGATPNMLLGAPELKALNEVIYDIKIIVSYKDLNSIADDEITFDKPVTLGEMHTRLVEKFGKTAPTFHHFRDRIEEFEMPHNQILTPTEMIHICDCYGCIAVLNFIDADINGSAVARAKRYSQINDTFFLNKRFTLEELKNIVQDIPNSENALAYIDKSNPLDFEDNEKYIMSVNTKLPEAYRLAILK